MDTAEFDCGSPLLCAFLRSDIDTSESRWKPLNVAAGVHLLTV